MGGNGRDMDTPCYIEDVGGSEASWVSVKL